MWFLYPKTISAEGGRKQKNRRDLLLTHEKPILNQVIDLSWTAVVQNNNFLRLHILPSKVFIVPFVMK
jgi:hypothetical protein